MKMSSTPFERFEYKLSFSISSFQNINPKRAGIFGRSKSQGGGAESPHSSFHAPVLIISMQINPNTISNESWHLYLSVETLNIILSCIVLP